jgi:hypothetical protein
MYKEVQDEGEISLGDSCARSPAGELWLIGYSYSNTCSDRHGHRVAHGHAGSHPYANRSAHFSCVCIWRQLFGQW